MKQIAFLSKLLVFTLLFGALFASCSSEDDSLQETEISVNVYNLILGAEKNSNSTFTITSNENWEITDIPTWINLSSTRGGAGTSTITVTTTSANDDSSADRQGKFTIIANEKTIIIDVTQKSTISKGCDVYPTNIVTLTDGIAFDFSFGSNVSYYYYGYIEQDKAGIMTDAEIVEYAFEYFERHVPKDDHLGVLSSLKADTEHCIICFGYDNKGNRGDINKRIVRTRSQVTNRPYVNISNITYTADLWKWSTSKGGFTSKYYQSVWTGDVASYLALYCPLVEIAWYMKSFIDNGLTPALNDETWSTTRNGSNEILIATWAMDEKGNLAETIDCGYGMASTSYNIEKSLEKYERGKIYTSSKNLFQESISTYTTVEE